MITKGTEVRVITGPEGCHNFAKGSIVVFNGNDLGILKGFVGEDEEGELIQYLDEDDYEIL